MQLDQVKQIIDNRLKIWGSITLDQPEAAISGAYSIVPGNGGRGSSTQERYVSRWDSELSIATEMAKAIDPLSDEQKRLLTLRYVYRKPWENVARALHVSVREAQNEREAILICLAYEFDLLKENARMRYAHAKTDDIQ